MPTLRIIAENKNPVEINIGQIDPQLDKILSDSLHLSSPKNIPTVERNSDIKTGYIKAGSDVFIPATYIDNYESSRIGDTKDYVTYTFCVAWDLMKIKKHADDIHWNLKIYQTIHLSNGKIKTQEEYTLPEIEGVDHIIHSNWIIIEVMDDSNKPLFSRQFNNNGVFDI